MNDPTNSIRRKAGKSLILVGALGAVCLLAFFFTNNLDRLLGFLGSSFKPVVTVGTPFVAGMQDTVEENSQDLLILEMKINELRTTINDLSDRVSALKPIQPVIMSQSAAVLPLTGDGGYYSTDIENKINYILRQMDSDRVGFSLGQNNSLPANLDPATLNVASGSLTVDSAGDLTAQNITAQDDLTVQGNFTLAGTQTNSGISIFNATSTFTGLVGIGTAAPVESLDIAGRFHLAQTAAPVTVTDRLYNVLGNLYWNGSNLTGGGVLPGGTEGQMLYNNAGSWTAFSDIYWDDTNNRMGIGTTAPGAKLTIQGSNSTAQLGDELVTNGTFGSDLSGWAAGAGWSWSGGKALHTAGSTAALSQSIAVGNSITYQVELSISGATAGSVVLTFGSMSGSYTGNYYDSSIKKSFTSAASGNADLTITPSSNFNGSIDNVTVKMITGGSANLLSLLNDDGSSGLELRSGGASKSNTAIGNGALARNINGSMNVAVGYAALNLNTNGNTNTAVGYSALNKNTNGTGNIAIGDNSLGFNTSGNENIGIGSAAMYSNTTGYRNVGVGYTSLLLNTTGTSNVAVGWSAMLFNSTGYQNVAVGESALSSNSTGYYNTGLGYNALASNTTGVSNTGTGFGAMWYNTTGSYNTSSGHQALRYNKTGSYNTAIGMQAGMGVNNNSYSNATLLGYRAGYVLTTGSNNLLLGYQAGDNLTTGSNNIVVGYDIDAPTATSTNILNIGNLLYGTGINGTGTTLSTGNVGIGITAPEYKLDVKSATADIARFNGSNSTGCTLSTGGVISCSSDQRLKTNIDDIVYGLNEIRLLRPVEFNWIDDNASTTKSLGFIAQQVEAVIPKLVTSDNNGYKELNTIGLVPVITKAIQEQQIQIDELKSILGNNNAENYVATSTEDISSSKAFSMIDIIRDALMSLGMAIQDGVASLKEIFADKINSKNITTQQMCVTGNDGETICIDKDQLKSLLESAGTPKTTTKIFVPQTNGGQETNSTSTTAIEEADQLGDKD